MKIFEFSTLSEVEKAIDRKAKVYFDTETQGLYGKIALAQFYQESWTTVKLVKYPNPFELAVALRDMDLVIQNASYDITVIQRQSGTRFIPEKFNDTFLLARLCFYELESFSLDDLLIYVSGRDIYADNKIDKAVMQKFSWELNKATDLHYTYASLDVMELPKLYNQVKAKESETSYRLDMLSLRYALNFQCNGMYVDKTLANEIYSKNCQIIKDINLPINANSYVQVRKLLNTTESDDLALARLELFGNTKARDIRTVRMLSKQNSFLDKYKETEDDYIYGCFAPSARSGRFTCKESNLQQIPSALRNIFTAPEGMLMVYADYSQLELRCAADITSDVTMIRLFKEGIDIHNYTAEMIYGKNFTAEQRQIAKTCNFNLLYGGAAPKLQSILVSNGLSVPLPELEVIIRKWKSLFKGVVQWQERGVRAWKAKKPNTTPLGRPYKAKLYTDYLNIENQGFGAEVAKLALHRMYPKLKAEGIILVNFVHDSYIAYAEEKKAKDAADIIGLAMKSAWEEVRHNDIPMPVDVKVGFSWGLIESKKYTNLYKY